MGLLLIRLDGIIALILFNEMDHRAASRNGKTMVRFDCEFPRESWMGIERCNFFKASAFIEGAIPRYVAKCG